MQAAAGAAARQRDVDRLGGESLVHQRIGERLAARGQRGFDLLLGDVDAGAFGLACFGIELAEALQQLGQRPDLPRKRAFVFQRGDVGSLFEGLLRVGDDWSRSIDPSFPTSFGLGEQICPPNKKGSEGPFSLQRPKLPEHRCN
jgi:hypothetical protein